MFPSSMFYRTLALRSGDFSPSLKVNLPIIVKQYAEDIWQLGTRMLEQYCIFHVTYQSAYCKHRSTETRRMYTEQAVAYLRTIPVEISV